MSKMFTNENHGFVEIHFSSAELSGLVDTLDFTKAMLLQLSSSESSLPLEQRQLLEQRAALAKALYDKLVIDGDVGRPSGGRETFN